MSNLKRCSFLFASYCAKDAIMFALNRLTAISNSIRSFVTMEHVFSPCKLAFKYNSEATGHAMMLSPLQFVGRATALYCATKFSKVSLISSSDMETKKNQACGFFLQVNFLFVDQSKPVKDATKTAECA
jgi:hypothetical protein